MAPCVISLTGHWSGVNALDQAHACGTTARPCAAAWGCQTVVTVVVRHTDRYVRLGGEVLVPDGCSLSLELVKAGLAQGRRSYCTLLYCSMEESAR